ncbi:hypothetical protein SAMN04488494_0606 [Xylanibacter ruminicola]|jgi:hypothetical protein|uniref:Phage major capsid protein E n=1 Tax=Xylanibacter ruminicola TaxID=839 RepID=A0A1M7D3B0_XYLRU|nr:hypothetical protein [Xylanibacter ruminicola]SHL73669.1 hypothetical protein SAMN04488494_0606 [Xylanibacter ruminicola]
MKTVPVTLRDMIELGMYGENWQTFIDKYDERFNAITIDGFSFAPISLSYQFQQMLAKVHATVLPTYVDPDSEGYEMPLGSIEGKTGNIPTQKLFYSVNRNTVREQMQLAQRFGELALDDEMADVMYGLLDEGTNGLYQAFVNALNHQRHQVVSTGKFTINATNNPRGIKGVTIGFNMPDANHDILTGEQRWWTDADREVEGKAADPLVYLKNRVKHIRRVLHYSGPLRMEISQDLWDDMLGHSKVQNKVGNFVYRNVSSDAVRSDLIEFDVDEVYKEAIRKMIKVDEIVVRETYSFVCKPGVDENGEPDLIEERIDNFDPCNIAFIPTGKLGDIQGVQPLSMGYDADKVAYAMSNRLLVEQEDIPRTHSINVNGEMSQLCVPNAIRHMFISTVAVKPKQEAAGKTTKKG